MRWRWPHGLQRWASGAAARPRTPVPALLALSAALVQARCLVQSVDQRHGARFLLVQLLPRLPALVLLRLEGLAACGPQAQPAAPVCFLLPVAVQLALAQSMVSPPLPLLLVLVLVCPPLPRRLPLASGCSRLPRAHRRPLAAPAPQPAQAVMRRSPSTCARACPRMRSWSGSCEIYLQTSCTWWRAAAA